MAEDGAEEFVVGRQVVEDGLVARQVDQDGEDMVGYLLGRG